MCTHRLSVRLLSVGGKRIGVAERDSVEILIPFSKRQIGKQERKKNEAVSFIKISCIPYVVLLAAVSQRDGGVRKDS